MKLEGYRSFIVGFAFLLAALLVYLLPALLKPESAASAVELAKTLAMSGAAAFSIGKIGEGIKRRQ